MQSNRDSKISAILSAFKQPVILAFPHKLKYEQLGGIQYTVKVKTNWHKSICYTCDLRQHLKAAEQSVIS